MRKKELRSSKMLIYTNKCPWDGLDEFPPESDPLIRKTIRWFVEFTNGNVELKEDVYLVSMMDLLPRERTQLFGTCSINLASGLYGRKDGVPYIIVVRGDVTVRDLIDTLVHELAHYLSEWCQRIYSTSNPHRFTVFKMWYKKLHPLAKQYIVDRYVA